MAAFCIRPDLAEKLKAAAKAGEIAIEKMYTMSSEDRRKLFEKYVDPETAKGVNTGFEKAMSSEQQAAIGKWVKDTFSSREKQKPEYKDILTKINELHDKGVLTPENEKAFLEDLVADKLGVSVSKEEASTIDTLTQDIAKHSDKVSPVGTHTIEFYQAKRKMSDYLNSLTPNSNLRVFTSTIGRGTMLLSFKSPLLNIESNSIAGFLAAAERRIVQRRFNGFNNDFASKYRKYATDVYKKTGYDLSRFQAFGEGKMVRGEEIGHSQGKGIVRRTGRFFEDVAFNKMQGAPDAAFAAFHFTDSANLSSSVMALKEGLKGDAAKERALAIMKDAFSEEPETKEGMYVRAQAEADALYATFTNKSVASTIALSLRGIANKATGDFRLGEITDPFVKTPANVIAAGLDYSGATVTAKIATGILRTLHDVAGGKSFDRENFAEINKYMIRAGMGLTFSFLIAQMIKPEDFIGQYPTNPSEQKLLDARNAPTNAIKVGGHWISLDYLSVLGAPLLGFLYAKKYGNGSPADAAFRYAQGIGATIQNLPGLATIASAYDYIKNPPDKNKGVADAALTAGKNALGALTSRIIPGGIIDLGNMTDQYRREKDKGSLTSNVQGQIPGLIPGIAKGLPIKEDIFGTQEKTEPWISTLLFGSRVKSSNDSELLTELAHLSDEGKLPALTDVTKNSKPMMQLKQQIGDKEYDKASHEFGTALRVNMTDAIKTDEYKAADSEGRRNILNKVKQQTIKDTLDTYGYEKPEKP
jgi:hypothetical protein